MGLQVPYAHKAVGADLPYVNFLTEISSGPALAVFAFRGLRTLKQKHRSGLQVPTRTKQLVRFPTEIKKPRFRVVFKFLPGKGVNLRRCAD